MNLTGPTLDQKYLILEPIGESGMSMVYRAMNIQNQTAVAVKLMKEKVTSSYREGFLRFKRPAIGLSITTDFKKSCNLAFSVGGAQSA